MIIVIKRSASLGSALEGLLWGVSRKYSGGPLKWLFLILLRMFATAV